ncbi:MAG: Holliday junction branch migration protein RuvA [Muribaculaceae bacterium]|nr:Holliday junction branch migration protein RuvA [Muribaculaceae bacterium]
MIEYVKGVLASLTPTSATIETAGGVAYLLNITLPTYSALEGLHDTKLFVHESIREDAWVLYGFSDERERELFRSLIGVSGVGAATAVIILSSLQGDELAAVISGGDVKRLKAIKGIGAKTAERIIVDLRDKIKVSADTLFTQTPMRSDAFEEALAALLMLGFDKKHSEKALESLFSADPAIKVETAIKKALSMM